jgi:hypothetical protein
MLERLSILTNDWTWWHMFVIPGTLGSTNRKIAVQASPGIKQDPVLKITTSPTPSHLCHFEANAFYFIHKYFSMHSKR